MLLRVPLLAIALSAACTTPEAPRAPLAAFEEDIRQVLDRVPIPGLSVAVAEGDSVLWSHGYGVADAATGRPATVRTPYRIASITKTIAATVVLRLAEAGDLDLDASAGQYLDDPPAWAAAATIRGLLSHTSETFVGGDGRAAQRPEYAYSGRYDILAPVAEGAAGRPFPELLDSLVFRPAGMAATVTVDGLPGSWMADSLAAPHGPDGAPVAAELPARASAGNGVVSTVIDLTRFVEALTDGRLLDPGTVATMWSPAAGSVDARGDGETRAPGARLPYGLGWFVEPTPAGTLVWHGGQWPVYSGLLLHVPGEDLTLAVLANSWHLSHPYYAIGTGTVLYNVIGASFLRHLVLPSRLASPDRSIPPMPWDVAADSLARIGAGLQGSLPFFWGSELFGRGLLAREAGRPALADSLMAAAVACCRQALRASTDLGLLFHLGRSGDPELRAIGQAAGEDLLGRRPGDAVTRFNLAVSYVQGRSGRRAAPLLESLIADDQVAGWIRGWAAYLRAEQLAATDPARARRLLRDVLERGVDESGLLADTRALLESLEP